MSDSAVDPAGLIDHTVLKPDTSREVVARYCNEALTHRFKSVCVNSRHTAAVAARLAGSDVATCVVVGFPLGAMASAAKTAETRFAVEAGAQEIDMVLAIGALREGDDDTVRKDIAAVKTACGDALLKVIVETCLLTEAEKQRGCRLARAAGADFVKTSTGFAGGGATVADVRLMRETVGDALGVKASGGIRTRADALAMIEAGASRIGTSNGVALLGDR